MDRRPLLSFFVLANLFSWIAWAPLAAAGLGWTAICGLAVPVIFGRENLSRMPRVQNPQTRAGAGTPR